MTANVQGFLLFWYSVIIQPELILSKVNADDAIFFCLALFVQSGLQMMGERYDQYIISQHCRKPMLAAVQSTEDCSQINMFDFVVLVSSS